MSPSRISELVHGTRPVTADTALRLGLLFSMNPRFWLNLQTEYDVRIATREVTAKIAVGRMGNLPQRSARFLHTPSPLGRDGPANARR